MESNISLFISILSITVQIFSQDEIKIVASDPNSITIEYSPQYDTIRQVINEEEYIRINLHSGYIPEEMNWGEAEIPVTSVKIGVPEEFGNTIEILSSSYKELKGKLLPKGKPKLEKNMLVEEYIIGENYNNYRNDKELVGFGDYGIMRGIPAADFIIKPVKFYPFENKIVIYDKILFRINYSRNRRMNSGQEDEFLKGALPNYEEAKLWKTDRKKIKKTAASVLSTGRWVRFEAPAEGIYKIDNALFSSWGFDAGSTDPRTIKIYNNGGKQLPEKLEVMPTSDLIENAITVAGEEDGRFDEGDYILFYGRGINFWEYDSVSNTIVRFFTPYSKVNYFWITSGGNSGKRMEVKSGNLNVQSQYIQTTTKAFISMEADTAKVAPTGRYYVGDEYNPSAPIKIYVNRLDGRIDAVPLTYKLRFIAASKGSFTLNVEEGSKLILSAGLRGISGLYSAGSQLLKTIKYNDRLIDNTSQLRFRILNTNSASKGYLDFFEIYYEKSLTASGDALIFFSKDTSAAVEYRLNGFSSSKIRVFDVTDFANTKIITDPMMVSGSEFRFQEQASSGNISKYFALAGDNFKIPINAVNIINQNVTETAEAKLIIITHKNFKNEAERLKNYRESLSKYKLPTSIAYVDEIYNEFSGGMADPTAVRNFIRYAYDNWVVQPEYVLLLGDGTYDAKNIEGAGNNFVPTYQVPLISASEGLDLQNSYPVDDYFVRVDGTDPSGKDPYVDLAIGRLNVQTLEDAASAINKTIDYENNMERGSWQNLITLVADDGLTSDGDDHAIHTTQSETLSKLIPKSYNINKIYLPSYPTVIGGTGRTKPEVNKAIINAINSGTLIMNYIGHGNYEVWAHEGVFEKNSTISQLHNNKYFFLTAATCSFGQFDLTGTQSGTEMLILKEGSGALGAFTATRVVNSVDNEAINLEFYRKLLLSPRESDNLPCTIGRAYMLTKLAKIFPNDQKFHFFGDPTLRLRIPHYNSEIDSINGLSVRSASDKVQLKALSKVTLSGTIKRPDNSIWEDYNGEAVLSIFDSERNSTIEERINNSYTNEYKISNPGGILFNGKISVINGNYRAGFVMPKDISYENKNGKAVVYFYNNTSDGIGYTDNFIVGGSDTGVVNDDEGPEIEIHFDNTTAASSNIVNPDSRLIINLTDETGINTTGTGIGHKLEGVLNENEYSPIDFTEYFEGDLDAGGKAGKINYQFNGLTKGPHKLEVKAWDVFNNFSSAESYFTVVDGNDLVISDVYNYPNPFSNNTTFTFQKNQQNGIFNVIVKIYTVAGRMIKKIDRLNVSDEENFVKLDWDGRDEDGNLAANGVYLYRIIVKSADGRFNKSVVGKLAILR